MAVVQLNEGCDLEEISLRDYARTQLAGYKVPKRILSRESLERAPNGKADYKLIRNFAAEQLDIAL